MKSDSQKPGEIRADSLYTLEELCERLQLGRKSLRIARRQGLKGGRIGRRCYVLGRDFIEWYTRQAQPLVVPRCKGPNLAPILTVLVSRRLLNGLVRHAHDN